MPSVRKLAALFAFSAAGGSVWAKPITSPDQLTKSAGNTVTIDFKELRGKDKLVFGSPEIGQPYAQLGLVLPSQMIDAPVKNNPSQAVSVHSTGISTIDNSSYQSIAFTHPQRFVGFTVKSPKATSVVVTALDKNGRTLDEVILSDAKDPKFIGFAQDSAEITVIRVVAPHATMGDAQTSPTSISGITFASLASEESTNGAVSIGSETGGDYGLARAVGSPGASGSLAYNGAGAGDAGVDGSGSAGTNTAGRNPGNRNPNLPPATIPEPAGYVGASMLAVVALRRRRD
jgi:hypothetical protein